MEKHLTEILGCLDLDIFTDQRRGQETYTVRLWDQGESVIEVTRHSLTDAVRVAAENAGVYVNRC